MNINAENLYYKELNQRIREASDKYIVIENCLGQRYIGTGQADKDITIYGTPGNDLGAYLDGCTIRVKGNAQDATGDTMNDGVIYIHGNSGDACGYAMRGGKIFIRDNAGYRTGIHMKQYKEKKPVIVIGGSAGSFLGEYLAGGIIIVLGLNSENTVPVGDFCGTGMHGGKIYLRCNTLPCDLPKQVIAREATGEDMEEIKGYIEEFCQEFGKDKEQILNSKFFCLIPNTKNPYKQLYTHN
ncbi:MAG TPA: glutamate synthase [Acetivibrio sp.]|uniref:GltB/FmdC/FwdC-like GXGXG domain-containing protein n=1 Tax=Acetivibrio sp. TaxID=1872092 RepID=UPI002B9DF366|nr:glutamate synthase [Acetivibrio sp.]HOM01951.1 glutamate synthase [Acetivibrio sp.]